MKKLMRLDRAVDEESAKDDNSQEDRAGCSDHLLDYVCICICICFFEYLEFAVFVGEENNNWQAANDNALENQAM